MNSLENIQLNEHLSLKFLEKTIINDKDIYKYEAALNYKEEVKNYNIFLETKLNVENIDKEKICKAILNKIDNSTSSDIYLENTTLIEDTAIGNTPSLALDTSHFNNGELPNTGIAVNYKNWMAAVYIMNDLIKCDAYMSMETQISTVFSALSALPARWHSKLFPEISPKISLMKKVLFTDLSNLNNAFKKWSEAVTKIVSEIDPKQIEDYNLEVQALEKEQIGRRFAYTSEEYKNNLKEILALGLSASDLAKALEKLNRDNYIPTEGEIETVKNLFTSETYDILRDQYGLENIDISMIENLTTLNYEKLVSLAKGDSNLYLSEIQEILDKYYSTSIGQADLRNTFIEKSSHKYDEATANTDYIQYCLATGHGEWLSEDYKPYATILAMIDSIPAFSQRNEITDAKYIADLKDSEYLPYGVSLIDGKYYCRDYTFLGENELYYMDLNTNIDNLEEPIYTAFSIGGKMAAEERNYKGICLENLVPNITKEDYNNGHINSNSNNYEELFNADMAYRYCNGEKISTYGLTDEQLQYLETLSSEDSPTKNMIKFSDYCNTMNTLLDTLPEGESLTPEKILSNLEKNGIISQENNMWNFSYDIDKLMKENNWTKEQAQEFVTNFNVSILNPIAFNTLTGTISTIHGLANFFESSVDAINTIGHSDFMLSYLKSTNVVDKYKNMKEIIDSYENLSSEIWKVYANSSKYNKDYENYLKSSQAMTDVGRVLFQNNKYDGPDMSGCMIEGKFYATLNEIPNSIINKYLSSETGKYCFKEAKMNEFSLSDKSSSNQFTAALRAGIRAGGDFTLLNEVRKVDNLESNAYSQFDTMLEVSKTHVDDKANEWFYDQHWYQAVEDLAFIKHDNILGTTLNQIGNMAVPVALSFIPGAGVATTGALSLGGLASSSALWLSAYGGAAQEAFLSGSSYNDAMAYATISASNELAVEWLFGGMGGAGVGSFDNIIASLPNFLFSKSTALTNSAFAQTLKTLVIKGIGEGAEEVFTDMVATPLAQSLTYMSDKTFSEIYNESVTAESLLQTFAVSFLSGLVFGGSSINRARTTLNNQIDALQLLYADAEHLNQAKSQILAKIIGQMATEESGVSTTETINIAIENVCKNLMADPQIVAELETLKNSLSGLTEDQLMEKAIEKVVDASTSENASNLNKIKTEFESLKSKIESESTIITTESKEQITIPNELLTQIVSTDSKIKEQIKVNEDGTIIINGKTDNLIKSLETYKNSFLANLKKIKSNFDSEDIISLELSNVYDKISNSESNYSTVLEGEKLIQLISSLSTQELRLSDNMALKLISTEQGLNKYEISIANEDGSSIIVNVFSESNLSIDSIYVGEEIVRAVIEEEITDNVESNNFYVGKLKINIDSKTFETVRDTAIDAKVALMNAEDSLTTKQINEAQKVIKNMEKESQSFKEMQKQKEVAFVEETTKLRSEINADSKAKLDEFIKEETKSKTEIKEYYDTEKAKIDELEKNGEITDKQAEIRRTVLEEESKKINIKLAEETENKTRTIIEEETSRIEELEHQEAEFRRNQAAKTVEFQTTQQTTWGSYASTQAFVLSNKSIIKEVDAEKYEVKAAGGIAGSTTIAVVAADASAKALAASEAAKEKAINKIFEDVKAGKYDNNYLAIKEIIQVNGGQPAVGSKARQIITNISNMTKESTNLKQEKELGIEESNDAINNTTKNETLFRPKGGKQKFVKIPDNIILNQWGSNMKIAAGGYINITNAEDMYGISSRDFEDTYKVTNESTTIGENVETANNSDISLSENPIVLKFIEKYNIDGPITEESIIKKLEELSNNYLIDDKEIVEISKAMTEKTRLEILLNTNLNLNFYSLSDIFKTLSEENQVKAMLSSDMYTSTSFESTIEALNEENKVKVLSKPNLIVDAMWRTEVIETLSEENRIKVLENTNVSLYKVKDAMIVKNLSEENKIKALLNPNIKLDEVIALEIIVKLSEENQIKVLANPNIKIDKFYVDKILSKMIMKNSKYKKSAEKILNMHNVFDGKYCFSLKDGQPRWLTMSEDELKKANAITTSKLNSLEFNELSYNLADAIVYENEGLSNKAQNVLIVLEKSPKQYLLDYYVKEENGHSRWETMTDNQIKLAGKIVERIINSNSIELYKSGDKFADYALKQADPVKAFDIIESVFLKNNLPYVGKIFEIFERVQVNQENSIFNNVHPPTLKTIQAQYGTEIESRKALEKVIFRDLIRISLKSNNRSVIEYLESIKQGNILFEQVTSQQDIDNLTIEERKTLEVYVSHLDMLYQSLKGRTIWNEKYSLYDNIKRMNRIFATFNKNNVPDMIVKSFMHDTGFDTLESVEKYIREERTTTDNRNREFVRNIPKEGIRIKQGDMLKGISSIDYLEGMLQNGILPGEFVPEAAESDGTPLGSDWYVKQSEHLEIIKDAMNNSGTLVYGDVIQIVLSPTSDTVIDTSRNKSDIDNFDYNKLEVYDETPSIEYSHQDMRTGCSFADISYISFSLENGRDILPKLKLEIVKNGFYIPVIDNVTGQALFTPEEYDLMRSKMNGLSYYGINRYQISNNLDMQEVTNKLFDKLKTNDSTLIQMPIMQELIGQKSIGTILPTSEEVSLDFETILKGNLSAIDSKEIERIYESLKEGKFDSLIRSNSDKLNVLLRISELDAERKRNAINTTISEVLKEFNLELKTVIDGDITPGFVESIDTGSTGRGSNVPGDGDFDFTMRVDSDIFNNSLGSLSDAIVKKLQEKGYNAGDSVITSGGGIRYKGVIIEGLDTPVDIDISFVKRTNKVSYSTDMALADRYSSMSTSEKNGVIANIISAKQLLKQNECYKPYRSDSTQGGMGGVGVENFLLQNGGSLIDSAKDFISSSRSITYEQYLLEHPKATFTEYISNTDAKSWEAFKTSYRVWDFGKNHFAELHNESYPHNNFIYDNMNSNGYIKTLVTFEEYIKSHDVESNFDSTHGSFAQQSSKKALIFDNAEMDKIRTKVETIFAENVGLNTNEITSEVLEKAYKSNNTETIVQYQKALYENLSKNMTATEASRVMSKEGQKVLDSIGYTTINTINGIEIKVLNGTDASKVLTEEVIKTIKEMDPKLVHEVVINNTECPNNYAYANEHNIKGFRASATTNVDSGRISLWDDTISTRTMNHEYSHLIAKEVTLTNSNITELWRNAIKSDGQYVSEYASVSIEEDFAESLSEYMEHPIEFAIKFPERYNILKENVSFVMEESSMISSSIEEGKNALLSDIKPYITSKEISGESINGNSEVANVSESKILESSEIIYTDKNIDSTHTELIEKMIKNPKNIIEALEQDEIYDNSEGLYIPLNQMLDWIVLNQNQVNSISITDNMKKIIELYKNSNMTQENKKLLIKDLSKELIEIQDSIKQRMSSCSDLEKIEILEEHCDILEAEDIADIILNLNSEENKLNILLNPKIKVDMFSGPKILSTLKEENRIKLLHRNESLFPFMTERIVESLNDESKIKILCDAEIDSDIKNITLKNSNDAVINSFKNNYLGQESRLSGLFSNQVDFDGTVQYGTNQGIVRKIMQSHDYILQCKLIKQVQLKYPEMKFNQAKKFLNLIEGEIDGVLQVGVCNYATIINSIYDYYKDNLADFKKVFGFNMYTTNLKGQKVFNDAQLLVDMFATINDGILVKRQTPYLNKWFVENNNKEYINLNAGFNVNISAINNYFNKKGMNLEISSKNLLDYYQILSKGEQKEASIPLILNQIAISLKKSNSIIITSNNFSLYSLEYKASTTCTDWHVMTVTGVTKDGKLLVDSWGKKCVLDLEDVISSPDQIYISEIGIYDVNKNHVESFDELKIPTLEEKNDLFKPVSFAQQSSKKALIFDNAEMDKIRTKVETIFAENVGLNTNEITSEVLEKAYKSNNTETIVQYQKALYEHLCESIDSMDAARIIETEGQKILNNIGYTTTAKINGIEIKVLNGVDADSVLTPDVIESIEGMNPNLVHEVIVNNTECPSNYVYANEHNIKGFRASATAKVESGRISLWDQSISSRTMNHEYAHFIANEVVKSNRNIVKLWKNAIDGDGQYVSEYASVSIEEDFAESLAEYMLHPIEFAIKFPERYNILKENISFVMEESSMIESSINEGRNASLNDIKPYSKNISGESISSNKEIAILISKENIVDLIDDFDRETWKYDYSDELDEYMLYIYSIKKDIKNSNESDLKIIYDKLTALMRIIRFKYGFENEIVNNVSKLKNLKTILDNFSLSDSDVIKKSNDILNMYNNFINNLKNIDFIENKYLNVQGNEGLELAIESLKSLITNNEYRKLLTTKQIHDILVDCIRLNKDKIGIKQLELKYQKLIKQIWENSLTNEIKNNEKFRFLFSNISGGNLKAQAEALLRRPHQSSCSMISSNFIATYGNKYRKIGFIYPNNSEIIMASSYDLGSNVFGLGSINQEKGTLLATPKAIEECGILRSKKQGEDLYSSSCYNEILVNAKPCGIVLIGLGENNLNIDYYDAKMLSMATNLPIYYIDKMQYNGILSEEDKEYIAFHSVMSYLELSPVDFYNNEKEYSSLSKIINVYKEKIVDTFLKLKRNNNLNKENMCRMMEKFVKFSGIKINSSIIEKAIIKKIGSFTNIITLNESTLAQQSSISKKLETNMSNEEIYSKNNLFINDTVKKFIEKNNINLKELSIKFNENRKFKLSDRLKTALVFEQTIKKEVSIANIIGTINGKFNIEEYLSLLNRLFNSNGNSYQQRSIGLLEYNNGEVISELKESFINQPIDLYQIDDNNYVIHNNGMHRITVLIANYYSELMQAKTNKDIEALNKKYTIEVNSKEMDYNKTYCNYILNGLSEIVMPEYNINGKLTGNSILEVGQVQKVLTDLELIKYTMTRIKSENIDLNNYPESIKEFIKLNIDSNEISKRDFNNSNLKFKVSQDNSILPRAKVVKSYINKKQINDIIAKEFNGIDLSNKKRVERIEIKVKELIDKYVISSKDNNRNIDIDKAYLDSIYKYIKDKVEDPEEIMSKQYYSIINKRGFEKPLIINYKGKEIKINVIKDFNSSNHVIDIKSMSKTITNLLERYPNTSLSEVNIYDTMCPDNYYYEKQYNQEGFRAYGNADIKKGTINIWASDVLETDTLIHEYGHFIANRLIEEDSNIDSKWIDAMNKDKGYVSNYAKTDIKEDFAESFIEFITNSKEFEKLFPERYKFMINNISKDTIKLYTHPINKIKGENITE